MEREVLTTENFDSIYEELAPQLLNYLRTKTRSLVQAEDLLSETFLKAITAAPYLKNRDNIRGWLFQIATNCFINSIRARHGQILIPTDNARDLCDDDTMSNPEKVITTRETFEEFMNAFSTLPLKHQKALYRSKGFRQLENTNGFNQSNPTTKERVQTYRAIKRLKREPIIKRIARDYDIDPAA